jgi:hypothetical protein
LRIRFRDQAFDTCVQRCHGRESAPVWSWLGANELKRSRAQYHTVWWKRRPQEQGQKSEVASAWRVCESMLGQSPARLASGVE